MREEHNKSSAHDFRGPRSQLEIGTAKPAFGRWKRSEGIYLERIVLSGDLEMRPDLVFLISNSGGNFHAAAAILGSRKGQRVSRLTAIAALSILVSMSFGR